MKVDRYMNSPELEGGALVTETAAAHGETCTRDLDSNLN